VPRASATIVLGVLSGALAALAVLPTIIPLTYRIVSVAESAEAQQAIAAAATVDAFFEVSGQLPRGIAESLQVSGVQVRTEDGSVTASDGALPAGGTLAALCDTSPANTLRFADGMGVQWVAACQRSDTQVAFAAHRVEPEDATHVAYLILGLAAMVGISTALGVLQVLSPLHELSKAIDRVGAGERGVRIANTGLTELDDLADRLNAAARAVEDREDAIQARIEVVQDLARLVAHEVRNPLQSLELLTSLIASESDRSERDDLAQSIHAEIRSLAEVVTRVLRDSEGHGALRPNRTLINILDVIDHVVAFRKFEARDQGTRLETGAMASQDALLDRPLVTRAIENLLQNALQSVPRKGGHVRLSVETDEDHVRIFVDDNGPGVDGVLGDTIYDANVTGRETGTGLGLALVKGVVVAHGGYVVHGTSPLGGARFEVCLPLDGAAVAKEAAVEDLGGGRQPV
jgi:signal transduction histidine kinase